MKENQDSQQEHAEHSFEKKELDSPYDNNQEDSSDEVSQSSDGKQKQELQDEKEQEEKKQPEEKEEITENKKERDESEESNEKKEGSVEKQADKKEKEDQKVEEKKKQEEDNTAEKEQKDNFDKKEKKKDKKRKEKTKKDEDKTDNLVKNKEEIDRELREIYEDQEGEVPDMSNFKTKQSNSMLRAFLIFLLSLTFLAGVAWAGFFFFQPQDRFSEENVAFSVEGDKEAQLGQEVHYRIKYQNQQNVPLSKADVNVRYPAGFEFDRSSPEPTNEDNNSWKLGTIKEASGDYIDIYGKIYGDINEEQSLRTFLNYTPANFSSPFQKIANFNTNISKASVEMKVDGPKKVAVGEKGTWEIKLVSDQVEPIEDLRVKINAGDNFRFTDGDFSSTNTPKNIKEIDEISNRKNLFFSGVFDSKKEDNQLEILLQTEEEKEDQIETERYLIAKSDYNVALSETSVSFNLAINGATDDFSTRPGKSLNTTLKVENNGEETVEDAQVKMTFDAPSNDRSAILERSLLNWGEIRDVVTQDIVGEQINENLRRGVITWDSSSIPDLAKIEPDEEIEISFTLPVKGRQDIDLTEFDTSTTTAKADLKYKMGDKVEAASANEMNITMNSDLTIDVKDTITENDKQQKVHNIAWTLNNSFHDLKNIKAEADIFGDIEWKEGALNATTGTAKYDSENQHITWKIDSLPKEAKTQTLNFTTRLEEQDPTQTNLTSKVRIKAKDQFTGNEAIVIGDEVLLTSSTSTTSSPF